MSEAHYDDEILFITPPLRVKRVTNDYRLAKKPNGEIILQRYFIHHDGHIYSYEWRDIETINLEE